MNKRKLDGARKYYLDKEYNHRKNYSRTKCKFYREKTVRIGHKGQYANHKVKGETLVGSLAHDIG